jgi:curli production assembly/transport component CsgF
MKTLAFGLSVFCCVTVLSSSAFAQQKVYVPVNPTFGGNPLNGTFLLNSAQAQGFGPKSGANSPNLTGLDNALSNLGGNLGTGTSSASTIASPIIVINPTTTSAGTIP